MLKIRERKSMPKKVLIYGLDGSGKSTFAEKFCRENGYCRLYQRFHAHF